MASSCLRNIDESQQWEYFRLAYRQVTGQLLKKVRKSERPDFICKRPDGSLVGIEFTLITRDPESSSCDSILDGTEYMNGYDGIQDAIEAISAKAEKLKGKNSGATDWQLPNSSILVLSTPDCPISEIEKFLVGDLLEELTETCQQSGFSEIWIADFTEIDAYSSIELFGLLPAERFGYHPDRSRGKPYG